MNDPKPLAQVDPQTLIAVRRVKQAAEEGNLEACYRLGVMDGKYVERDEAAALQWLLLAHVNGSSKAEEVIEHLIKRMPGEQVQAVREAMLRAAVTVGKALRKATDPLSASQPVGSLAATRAA